MTTVRRPKAVTLTIRIPADLKKRVAKAAADEDRTVTSFIVHHLKKVVDQESSE